MNMVATYVGLFLFHGWNRRSNFRSKSFSGTELGIVGQLPGFQGNVPVQIADIYSDHNITKAGATGWMDSLDPLFTEIADEWMKEITSTFGTDHWYQLDGYFNGGVAPWMDRISESRDRDDGNDMDDALAFERATKAFEGLNRTDPDAIWSYQGWQFVSWKTEKQARFIKAFVNAVPKDRFVVIDMSPFGRGQWHQWNNASFFGAPFMWTSIQDFGGDDGMKGNLETVNSIPFDALEQGANVVGTGGTPEGIDQNPAYWQFLTDTAWRSAPLSNIADGTVGWAKRRYTLRENDGKAAATEAAWRLLSTSIYTQDMSLNDGSGVTHLPAKSNANFFQDNWLPEQLLCDQYLAWKTLLAVAHDMPATETFRYDLINLGREVLAQLAAPISRNFSSAIKAAPWPDVAKVNETGTLYMDLLNDMDDLVAGDQAFLLGSWIAMARSMETEGANDCDVKEYNITSCGDFYEWNARSQLTTWHPTPPGSAKVPDGPVDYACKQWQGLIRDYYGKRVELVLQQAVEDGHAHRSLNSTAVDLLIATHAYEWQTSTKKYPLQPREDWIATSEKLFTKWGGPYYAPYCEQRH